MSRLATIILFADAIRFVDERRRRAQEPSQSDENADGLSQEDHVVKPLSSTEHASVCCVGNAASAKPTVGSTENETIAIHKASITSCCCRNNGVRLCLLVTIRVDYHSRPSRSLAPHNVRTSTILGRTVSTQLCSLRFCNCQAQVELSDLRT